MTRELIRALLDDMWLELKYFQTGQCIILTKEEEEEVEVVN